ncbi:hypothetical protein EMCG_01963 [[Emmonsia] crescens]|uniref:Uncharacterized protein n=1 Tax=[Emmonsia] crescens TaxID=73230 RepID=A0A0G2J225_9EURO|nr:hypothetical protein EMCG_01963 [Emmonsia crescens UAMH 3008]
MEEARGTQLTNVWENMDLDDKKTIIEDIIGFEKKLLSVSLSWTVSPGEKLQKLQPIPRHL